MTFGFSSLRRLTATIFLLIVWSSVARAEIRPVQDQIGDTFEITRSRDSVQRTSDEASSGSSTDRASFIERVVDVRAGGLELEYDLPKGATGGERASNWQFPARVFKPDHGALQLLNGPELEARLNTWLKAGKLTRAACGQWVFTWNLFRIECDPQSVLQTIGQLATVPEDLGDEASYRDALASQPTRLTRTSDGAGGIKFVGEMAVDPEIVRRDRARADVVAAEINRSKLTFEEAVKARSADTVSGTITTTFDVDLAGRVQRRLKITKLDTKRGDGTSATETVTESVERRLVAQAKR